MMILSSLRRLNLHDLTATASIADFTNNVRLCELCELA